MRQTVYRVGLMTVAISSVKIELQRAAGLYRVSKKNLIAFISKLAASLQEFDRSCLSISWVYKAYQISEPLIILKHKSDSLWE